MWKTFIGDFNSGQKKNIGIADLSSEQLSDLIHDITENGFKHPSGPVHAKNTHSITFIMNAIRVRD